MATVIFDDVSMVDVSACDTVDDAATDAIVDTVMEGGKRERERERGTV